MGQLNFGRRVHIGPTSANSESGVLLAYNQLPTLAYNRFDIVGWAADVGSMLAQGWNSNSDVANHWQRWANLSLLSGNASK